MRAGVLLVAMALSSCGNNFVSCYINQYVEADLNGRCGVDGGPDCVDCSLQGTDAQAGMAAQKCVLDAIAALRPFKLEPPPPFLVPSLGYSGYPASGHMVVREYAYSPAMVENGVASKTTVSLRLCNLDPPLAANGSCTLGSGGACLLCQGNQAGTILCAP